MTSKPSARRRPWLVGGIATAAGFVASRFLMASSERRYESRSQHAAQPRLGSSAAADETSGLPAPALRVERRRPVMGDEHRRDRTAPARRTAARRRPVGSKLHAGAPGDRPRENGDAREGEGSQRRRGAVRRCGRRGALTLGSLTAFLIIVLALVLPRGPPRSW